MVYPFIEGSLYRATLDEIADAARMPRLYDLALALLLLHCDLLSAPGRMWTSCEWQAFRQGYVEHIVVTDAELEAWQAVLGLAWLDQGLWLLGNWPEG